MTLGDGINIGGPVGRCRLAHIEEELDQKGRDWWEPIRVSKRKRAQVDDRSPDGWSYVAIRNEFRKEGYFVGVNTIREHVQGNCLCGETP